MHRLGEENRFLSKSQNVAEIESELNAIGIEQHGSWPRRYPGDNFSFEKTKPSLSNQALFFSNISRDLGLLCITDQHA